MKDFLKAWFEKALSQGIAGYALVIVIGVLLFSIHLFHETYMKSPFVQKYTNLTHINDYDTMQQILFKIEKQFDRKKKLKDKDYTIETKGDSIIFTIINENIAYFFKGFDIQENSIVITRKSFKDDKEKIIYNVRPMQSYFESLFNFHFNRSGFELDAKSEVETPEELGEADMLNEKEEAWDADADEEWGKTDNSTQMPEEEFGDINFDKSDRVEVEEAPKSSNGMTSNITIGGVSISKFGVRRATDKAVETGKNVMNNSAIPTDGQSIKDDWESNNDSDWDSNSEWDNTDEEIDNFNKWGGLQ